MAVFTRSLVVMFVQSLAHLLPKFLIPMFLLLGEVGCHVYWHSITCTDLNCFFNRCFACSAALLSRIISLCLPMPLFLSNCSDFTTYSSFPILTIFPNNLDCHFLLRVTNSLCEFALLKTPSSRYLSITSSSFFYKTVSRLQYNFSQSNDCPWITSAQLNLLYITTNNSLTWIYKDSLFITADL